MYNLSMIRGDTTSLKFQRKDNDGNVIMLQADKAYFTVKKSTAQSNYLIQKTLDDMVLDEEGVYHFTINPEDTDDLDYGTYVYDLEIIQNEVVTTISRGEFIIESEVTFAENED